HPTKKEQESDAPLDLPTGAQVLVIDDDPLIQQLLRRRLEDEGLEVLVAGDGIEGLMTAREAQPAVIVLDIHLPRLDGWSVLSSLKSADDLRHIPVIMLSIEEDRQRGFSLGAFDYLVKPVEPDELVQVLSAAISPDSGEVLVVDDDASTRDIVGRRLRAEGFAVSEAPDGDDALLRVRVSPPALMVLDLVMPRVDGFEVLAKVRDDGHEFPVVILTGKELSRDEAEALGEGLAKIIRKNGRSTEEVVEQAKAHVLRRRAVQAARKPKVLYVEDIEQNRDIVRRYLSGIFDMTEAEDGRAGLRAAKEVAPDLILMDLSLPHMDGWEVTRQLKADPKLERIPVVALTAHATRQDMELATEVGCCDYLTKPVDRGRLIGTIRRHLQGGSRDARGETAAPRTDGG
ncbi:MAG: response regulator, partial [Myxococcota bacterium]